MEGLAKLAAPMIPPEVMNNYFQAERNMADQYNELSKGEKSRTGDGLPKMIGTVTPSGLSYRFNTHDFHQQLRNNPELSRALDQTVDASREAIKYNPNMSKTFKKMERLENPVSHVVDAGIGAGVGSLSGLAAASLLGKSKRAKGLAALGGGLGLGGLVGTSNVIQRNRGREMWEESKNNEYNTRHYSTPNQLAIRGVMRDIYEN